MNIQNLISSAMVALFLLSGSAAHAAAEPAPAEASVQQALAVNVNTADVEELADLLHGVGMSRAQAIIDFREEHGPFKSAADLAQVRGIGPSTIEKNLAVIRLK